MNFSAFLNILTTLKTNKLGGQTSQFKLVPELRVKFSEEKIKNSNPKNAAVLALLYPNKLNKMCVLLTQRASYNGTHSAQISFVGGKSEKNETSTQTALRESFEEVGVPISEVNIIRELTKTYIPPSNFMVTPVFGYTNKTPLFKPNYEVEKIIEVPIDALINDKHISSIELETSYMKKVRVPCFNFENQIVWGATAMILSEIKDLLKEVT